VNEDEENDVVDLSKDEEMWWICFLSWRRIVRHVNKDDEGMSWICFLFLGGKSWRMWIKMKKTMLWIYYFFPEGNPLGIWINMNEDEETDVVDSTKDDERKLWLCILSWRKMVKDVNEDWWNIVCLVCGRWMKKYQRRMKDCVCVLFMEDGWKTTKERWKIVCLVCWRWMKKTAKETWNIVCVLFYGRWMKNYQGKMKDCGSKMKHCVCLVIVFVEDGWKKC